MVDRAYLERVKGLEAKATPGKWFTVPYGDGDTIVIHSDDEMRIFFPPPPVGYSASPGSHGDPAQIRADMDFVAESRVAVPALVAEVERCWEALDKVRELSAAKEGLCPMRADLYDQLDAIFGVALNALREARAALPKEKS
jgi:hypothetical protein